MAAKKQPLEEKRRFIAAMSAHFGAAYISNPVLVGTDNPSPEEVAAFAVRMAYAVMNRLERTEAFSDGI